MLIRDREKRVYQLLIDSRFMINSWFNILLHFKNVIFVSQIIDSKEGLKYIFILK